MDAPSEAMAELEAHPEGGRFRRLFESSDEVITHRGAVRKALTHIHYALDAGEHSRFHRVGSDEVWNLYRGRGLRLYLWQGDGEAPQCLELSSRVGRYCHVVPAGSWQAAEPMDGPVLMGCTVGPGFDWEDFEMIDAQPALGRALLALAPELVHLIEPGPER
ncbi:cupin domain-containing protein [Wenzhouxiangella marina]|uniref:Uncharacterized protein n=1 Tax=Wenzhouxiangella marina TaxID=1579979 RepID=A0A0K0Y0I2_9GAMM|nr:cupin domain-containing protein [Wenzhouxiangella marina]AKS43376.1 hypothetical protein WM2015_3024 [Wenzhouxiangella marina]MBB6088508.1 hypothetical protein [Wenzhouxiangella marina]